MQLEEERELQREQRKLERQNVLAKKRSLDSLVKDATKRSVDYEKKVSQIQFFCC